MVLFVAAWMLSLLPRLLGVLRFKQSILGVIFHPVAIAWFLGINWHAFLGQRHGHAIKWRGRAYEPLTDQGSSGE